MQLGKIIKSFLEIINRGSKALSELPGLGAQIEQNNNQRKPNEARIPHSQLLNLLQIQGVQPFVADAIDFVTLSLPHWTTSSQTGAQINISPYIVTFCKEKKTNAETNVV